MQNTEARLPENKQPAGTVFFEGPYHGRLADPLLEQMATVFADCFNAAPRFERWTPESIRHLIDDMMEHGAAVVLATDRQNRVAGYTLGLPLSASKLGAELIALGADPASYYLDTIAVLPGYHGQGIGRRLLKNCTEGTGAPHAPLSIRCRSDAIAIVNLLLSEQFQVISRYVTAVGNSSPAERLVLQKDIRTLC